ncbi:MAG: FAD-binding oxidoreductase [Alphaproteobacteria bacterium]
MNETSDVIVIGAGIAGASAAFHLAPTASVVILEAEDAPGYHTTGRSAALFVPPGPNPTPVEALVNGSESFFQAPPDGFVDDPLTSPLGALTVTGPDEEAGLEAMAAGGALGQRLNQAETLELCAAMRPEAATAGLIDFGVVNIDVHRLLQGYLRGVTTSGGRLITGARVTALKRNDGLWTVETAAGRFTAPMVINAAGAWADTAAEAAGVATIGLVPKRRTVINFDAPAEIDCSGFPIVGDVANSYFFRPEAGGLMASPADQTPSPPCDAQPDEIDMAIIVDRMQRATLFEIPRITHSRAGLRSFAPDNLPVAGMAPDTEGFLWLAGQGGFGIETSPALGRIAANLAQGEAFPNDINLAGVAAGDIHPSRLVAT